MKKSIVNFSTILCLWLSFPSHFHPSAQATGNGCSPGGKQAAQTIGKATGGPLPPATQPASATLSNSSQNQILSYLNTPLRGNLKEGIEGAEKLLDKLIKETTNTAEIAHLKIIRERVKKSFSADSLLKAFSDDGLAQKGVDGKWILTIPPKPLSPLQLQEVATALEASLKTEGALRTQLKLYSDLTTFRREPLNAIQQKPGVLDLLSKAAVDPNLSPNRQKAFADLAKRINLASGMNEKYWESAMELFGRKNTNGKWENILAPRMGESALNRLLKRDTGGPLMSVADFNKEIPKLIADYKRVAVDPIDINILQEVETYISSLAGRFPGYPAFDTRLKQILEQAAQLRSPVK